MTRLDFDPDLERLGEALRASTTIDLAREERADAPVATTTRRARMRPRVLAGSTLGLVGVGAALVLALGGSTAAPAFAITTSSDGSVLVKLNYTSNQNLPQVNQKLAAMGTDEQIGIAMATGPATTSGPVTCTPAPGASSTAGPPVKVLVGANGTEVISQGESAGNTAEGTFHLASCGVYPANTGLSTLRGYSGNS
ncbi:MAG TPA: hypothetical protein VGF91_12525 [Solirubrobacteraceae bacterium]|jgi:hypothetical protein